MASLPLFRRPVRAQAGDIGSSRRPTMEFVVVFFALMALASALGLVSDSRDSADWKPTSHGARAARWP
jgi:hypothetical protein